MKVRKIVWERDHHRCIFCHSLYAFPEAHVLPRSEGGLGIEQNVVTLCRECHRKMDQTTKRKELLPQAKAYLEQFYGSWDDEKVKYKKWTM